jgi:uncharacterized membrane protein
MKRLIEKWFPQATRQDRQKLENVIIICLVVLVVTLIFLAAVFLYLFQHRHQ